MKGIQSKKLKLVTYEIDKISLSCFDNKRYMADDGIHTFSYFHINGVKMVLKWCFHDKFNMPEEDKNKNKN